MLRCPRRGLCNLSELVKKIWLAQKKKHHAKERHILQKEALHFTATVVGIAAHLAPGDDDVHNKQKEREEHELQWVKRRFPLVDPNGPHCKTANPSQQYVDECKHPALYI